MKDHELPPQELENLEKALVRLQSELEPSLAFQERMKKRLERHHALMRLGTNEMGNEGVLPVSFFSRFTSRAYALAAAFVFVIFTGGLSTFAYTSDSVTNGNLLYPIKRGIETLESGLKSAPKAQAEFQVKLVRRRLAESRFLTLRGVVDPGTASDVSAAVTQSVAVIQSLPVVLERESLLLSVTTLLQEEEKKYVEIAGAKPVEQNVPPETSATKATIKTVRGTRATDAVIPSVNVNAIRDRTKISSPSPILPLPTKKEKKNNTGEFKKKNNERSSVAPAVVPAVVPAPATTPVPAIPSVQVDIGLQPMSQPDPPAPAATLPPQSVEAVETSSPLPEANNADTTTQNSSVMTPIENVTVPLNVETKVMEAIQQNREHLKSIEKKLGEIRKVR